MDANDLKELISEFIECVTKNNELYKLHETEDPSLSFIGQPDAFFIRKKRKMPKILTKFGYKEVSKQYSHRNLESKCKLFAQGNTALVKSPIITFLASKQKMTNGIYPKFEYDVVKDILYLKYEISFENDPKRTWFFLDTDFEKDRCYKTYKDASKEYMAWDYSAMLADLDDVIDDLEITLRSSRTTRADGKIGSGTGNVLPPSATSSSEIPGTSVNPTTPAPVTHPLNLILYGPPGTGKTYNTVNKALKIIGETVSSDREIAKKRYDELVDDGRIVFTTFHQSMSYEDFIEGIKPVTNSGQVTYDVKDGIFKKISDDAYKAFEKGEQEKKENYVLIIDEINRGNVAQIFGELITLIEPSKRWGEDDKMRVKLPYSQNYFYVPNNLYIIGTMNTADRSVEALDTALRRRFSFEEMMPDKTLLEGKIVCKVDLGLLLETINKRIVALKDREHQIGHSYFMGCETAEDLKNVFKDKIIPLLQEYFYGDYKKIYYVLGPGFVNEVPENKLEDVFPVKIDDDFDIDQSMTRYEITSFDENAKEDPFDIEDAVFNLMASNRLRNIYTKETYKYKGEDISAKDAIKKILAGAKEEDIKEKEEK